MRRQCDDTRTTRPTTMILMTNKELITQLQTFLAFSLLLDVISVSYGMPQSSVWRKITSQVTLEGSQLESLLPQSGAAIWLDHTAELVWMFGGQDTVNNKTTTFDHLWNLNLQTMKWIRIQPSRTAWPSGRHHAVLCSRGKALVLAGGIQESSSSSENVWKYDVNAGTWELEVGYENLLGNVTRFWCSDNDLFGLIQGESDPTLLQYHWDHKSWTRVPTRVGMKKAESELVPDLRNVSMYPLWPSDRGFVILYAPAKQSQLTFNSDLINSQCILWLLDKDVQWKPLLTGCKANDNCHGTLLADKQMKATADDVPLCRTHTGTWIDRNHNIWMHGGVSNTGALQDTWSYNLQTQSWMPLNGTCLKGCQGLHSSNIDPMTWTCNDTLFLFGGQHVNTSSNATLLAGIWTMDVSNFVQHSMLAVPPIGVFLISLSITFIVSLGTFVIIILVKCSSPMAPRIRPPVRTYGQVQYSPVNSDEVP